MGYIGIFIAVAGLVQEENSYPGDPGNGCRGKHDRAHDVRGTGQQQVPVLDG